MLDPLAHPSDYQFAQRCLDGNPVALQALKATYRAPLNAYLINAGAWKEEAAEIVDQLWADCLAPRESRPARLASYTGAAALATWLRTVALNNLIRRRRTRKWERKLVEPLDSWDDGDERPLPADPIPVSEEVLIELMRSSIESAFLTCPAEDFVLLQLAHADGLRGRELALMFGCSVAKISRDLHRASENIAAATLAHIHATDEWLDLKWDDFLELCRVASPACFGRD